MQRIFKFHLAILGFLVLLSCSSSKSSAPSIIMVNTLEDLVTVSNGQTSLRAALAQAASNQRIVFDQSINGGTIALSIVGEAHSILPGEVMGMRNEPSGPVSYLEGYFDRDYGQSALYARKNVIIDASELSSGITISWTGGDSNPARVLAVYGDLYLNNVNITGGRVVATDISDTSSSQPWTLARGCGVAVWGHARLQNSQFYDNHCEGDFDSSRDRGAFGGAIYANIVEIEDCVVAGNTVLGAGAAGGGIYSVGGASMTATTSRIERSSITGNRISGLFAYGGGVYSDGGGIGNLKTLEITNSTIARNRVDTPAGMPPFLLAMGYWRGGGAYMSNGHLTINNSTIVENEVHGVARTDSLSKPNLAGGVAATIGNAHAVEEMRIKQSIITGNTVNEIGGNSYAHDIFTGSLLYFISKGYNRIGVIDFSQMLVPVGETDWQSLSRRHYPKQGDSGGVSIADVLDMASIEYSDTINSAGVDAASPTVLFYRPSGSAVNQIPASAYNVSAVKAEYTVLGSGLDNFLSIILSRIENQYNLTNFASDFTADFETFLQTVDADDDVAGIQPYTNPSGDQILTLADTLWFGPAVTWPKELVNYPYIEFWHRLDLALAEENIPGFGPELLGDNAWSTLFTDGVLIENGDIVFSISSQAVSGEQMPAFDQLGIRRPVNSNGDIGAIEIP